jgi:4-diphosphocytidyl-2-C-methyl-D-erythritol kinase
LGLALKAYAKLNLTLTITGRRPDGYHTLQSLVVAVDWADEVHLEAIPRKRVELRTMPDLHIPHGENLVYRAAELLWRQFSPREGVRIVLLKDIPMGAGLGGGSSDAAATLVGLNELWELGLSSEELKKFARELGADVPFFLGESPAWMEGIGDLLRPADEEIPPAFLVLVPPFPCPTPEVYRLYDELPKPKPGPSERFPNDLWPAAVKLRPELARYAKELEGLGEIGVGMSGSGSALFAAFDGEDVAEWAMDELLERGVEGRLKLVRPRPYGHEFLGN